MKHQTTPCVAIIGSFRKHWQQIHNVKATIEASGIAVTNPIGQTIVNPHALFAMTESDDASETPDVVQSRATARVLIATCVYVVCPAGYVGTTTAYEIGRCIQRRTPLYFSESPFDLPVHVHDSHIISATQLVEIARSNRAVALSASWPRNNQQIEESVLSGKKP